MTACRSSASLVNSGSLQMTILDGSFTPVHSKPNAFPAASSSAALTRHSRRMPSSCPAFISYRHHNYKRKVDKPFDGSESGAEGERVSLLRAISELQRAL